MTRELAAAVVAVAAVAAGGAAPAVPPAETGRVRFEPGDDAKAGVPERYRLAARSFDFTLTPRFDLRHSGVEVSDLTFPSPVTSAVPENNTVHAEYFRPKGDGPFPACLVLDILDGRQLVSRGEAMWLAQNGVASLVVYMAHYGPRRPPGSKTRLLSPDVDATMAAVRQTVLDCRLAVAWLAARREVNPDRLGVLGTSLGSFLGALTAASEPRLGKVCLLLTGGGLVDAFYDHPKAKPFTDVIEFLGGGRDKLKALIAPADPITYADQLRAKKVLLVAASRDDVVPPAAAEALWAATGKQQIVWVDATHIGAALHIVPVMRAVIAHLKE
jgi:dienelactone hydrolase